MDFLKVKSLGKVDLEQCFLKCGLTDLGVPWKPLRGPQNQNYLPGIEDTCKNV